MPIGPGEPIYECYGGKRTNKRHCSSRPESEKGKTRKQKEANPCAQRCSSGRTDHVWIRHGVSEEPLVVRCQSSGRIVQQAKMPQMLLSLRRCGAGSSQNSSRKRFARALKQYGTAC